MNLYKIKLGNNDIHYVVDSDVGTAVKSLEDKLKKHTEPRYCRMHMRTIHVELLATISKNDDRSSLHIFSTEPEEK